MNTISPTVSSLKHTTWKTPKLCIMDPCVGELCDMMFIYLSYISMLTKHCMSPEFWSENTPWLDGIMQKGRQNLLMLQMAMYRILGHVVEALTYSSQKNDRDSVNDVFKCNIKYNIMFTMYQASFFYTMMSAFRNNHPGTEPKPQTHIQ